VCEVALAGGREQHRDGKKGKKRQRQEGAHAEGGSAVGAEAHKAKRQSLDKSARGGECGV
jgi:hypothetical protein